MTETTKLLNEYGLIAILAILLVGLGFTWRKIVVVVADKDSGLLATHREIMTAIKTNAESNRINAEANKINANCNDRHSRSHERTSRVLEALAARLGAMDIITATADDDSKRTLKEKGTS